MSLSADNPADLDRVSVELLRQPGGGTVEIGSDAGWSQRVRTDGATTEGFWVDVPAGRAGGSVVVSAIGDGPVDVLAWTAGRRSGGVQYANLGTIGATIGVVGRMDPAILPAELARLKPAAIVVAFGTNEAFDNDTDRSDYAARFEQTIRDLQRMAPMASILIVGPPDSARAMPGARRVAAPVAKRPPPGKRAAAPVRAAPTPVPRAVGSCGDPSWDVPRKLADVRDAQAEVSARLGLFFWDWQAAMGGRCSALAWANQRPPLMGVDRVHMFADGYRTSAAAFFDAVMAGYDRYRELRPAEPSLGF